MEKFKVKQYILNDESGNWLGTVVITADGMFAGVTEWGNLSHSWGHTGEKDFREFLLAIDVDYFGNKLARGLAYIVYSRKIDAACLRFAEKILPPLQKMLKAELGAEAATPA